LNGNKKFQIRYDWILSIQQISDLGKCRILSDPDLESVTSLVDFCWLQFTELYIAACSMNEWLTINSWHRHLITSSSNHTVNSSQSTEQSN